MNDEGVLFFDEFKESKIPQKLNDHENSTSLITFNGFSNMRNQTGREPYWLGNQKPNQLKSLNRQWNKEQSKRNPKGRAKSVADRLAVIQYISGKEG